MKSRASAPGKVILFGEHFVVYGVKAILCAIDKRVTVTAEESTKNTISIKSNIGKLELPTNKSIKEIDSPLKPLYYLAGKLIQKHNKKTGMSITVESEIPSGVGLGSSSACCVAGAAAISRLFEDASKEQILELAIEAEKTIFQNTSGADCTVCTFGGLMEYSKETGFSKIDAESNFHLVIANSKTEHSTEQVVSKVRKVRDSDEEHFSNLCKKESEIIGNVMKYLKNNDLKELGKLMHTNQELLESIGISNETIRQMIDTAEIKAHGAKITGAGGGGCIIALTDESNLDETISQLSGKNYECFSAKIDHEGLDTF